MFVYKISSEFPSFENCGYCIVDELHYNCEGLDS